MIKLFVFSRKIQSLLLIACFKLNSSDFQIDCATLQIEFTMKIVCTERQTPSPARFTNTVQNIIILNIFIKQSGFPEGRSVCTMLPYVEIIDLKDSPQWLAEGSRVPLSYLLWKSFAAALALVGLIQASHTCSRSKSNTV